MNVQARTAPLPPESYWKQDWFENEQRQVFHNNWIFAGFTQDLENHNDYLSLTVAGTPVIVRNMRGNLVAFHNICSHRHAIIHPEGKGNAPFRCMFHGWTYDDKGVPVSIPDNTRSFGFEKDDRCALALPSVAVETCGRFVFVRLASVGLSLRDWLGPLAPKLESVSTRFEIIYSRLHETWASNWKFGIEVTLEGYHLPFVHAGSFANHIGDPNSAPAAATFIPDPNEPYGHIEYHGAHSTNISAMSAMSIRQLTGMADRFGLQRGDEVSVYDHYFVYPNLMIGVSGDTVVCVERYEPRAPDKTDVTWWLTVGAPADPQTCEHNDWKYATNELSQWTALVMSEDRVACEAAQKGVRHAFRRAFLGQAEDRVRHLQSSLLGQIEAKARHDAA